MNDPANQHRSVASGLQSDYREEDRRKQRNFQAESERRQALYKEVLAELLALPLSSVRERIMESAATAQDGYSLMQIGNTLKLLDEVVHAVASMDERLREDTNAERLRGGVLGSLIGAGEGAAFGAR